MSVKITCDVKRLFGKALMSPLWKIRTISKAENQREKEKEKGRARKKGVSKREREE